MKKKAGKKKPSFKAPSSKKASPGKGSRRAKARSETPAPRRTPARGDSCQFVCSECYAEFILPANFSEDTLSCPECLHIGKRPDDDFLRTVLIHKAQEKKSLAITLAVGALFLVVAFALVWQASPFVSSELVPSTWLLGLSGLLLVALFALVARYEANRWEVYF